MILAFVIIRAMCGRFWWRWAGAASGRWGGRWSATKKRFACGRRPPGRTLKKSPQTKAHDRLSGRERTEPAAASLPYLVAARADAAAAISLQLEETFAHRRNDFLEFLLSDVSRLDSRTGTAAFPGTSAAAHSRTAAAGLGPPAGTPQPAGAGFSGGAERARDPGIPARLCPGAQSGRIHLGLLQTPRTAQRVSQGLRATPHRNSPRPPPHAPPSHPDYRLLEAGFFVPLNPIYYADVSKSGRIHSFAKIKRPLTFLLA